MIRVINIVEKVMVEETMVVVMLEMVMIMVKETMVIIIVEKVMVEETMVVMLEMVMMVDMVIMKTLWNCMKRVYLNTVPARHPYYSLHPPYFQT